MKWNVRDLELKMTSKPCFGTTVRRSANNRNYKNYEITHCLNKAHYNNVSYSFTHNKLAILYFGLVIYLYNLDNYICLILIHILLQLLIPKINQSEDAGLYDLICLL